MSKNEQLFENFLIENSIYYEKQIPINVKFNKSNKYKTDFTIYNKDKSDKIYIEIKGFMTLEVIYKLKHIYKLNEINFYILQMTESDWLHIKTNEAIQIQFNLLKDFYNKKIDSKYLNDISKDLLNKYILYKEETYNKWNKLI